MSLSDICVINTICKRYFRYYFTTWRWYFFIF